MMRLILLVLVILLSGCGGGKCIEPGLGVSTNSTEVKVPVMPEGADSKNPVRYWVNSGYRVEEDRELKLTVERTVNFCPLSTKSPPAVVRMYQDNFASKPKWFHNSHIDVLPGDQITFTARTYELNFPPCSKIVNGDSPVIYYDNSTVFKDKDCKRSVPAEQICSAGASSMDMPKGGNSKEYKLYMKDSSGKCTELGTGVSFPKVGGGTVKMPRLQFPLGYIGVVEKVGPNEMKTSAEHVIASGRLHDARSVRMSVPIELNKENCELFKKSGVSTTLKNLLSVKQLSSPTEGGAYTREYTTENSSGAQQPAGEKQVPSSEEKDKIAQMLSEYTEYDINCNCGYICKPDDEIGNKGCVRTIASILNNKLVCPTPVADLQAMRLYGDTGSSTSVPDIKIPDLKGKSIDDLKTAVESIKILDSSDTTKALRDNKQLEKVQDRAYELAEGVVAVIVGTTNAKYKDKGDISRYCSSNKECKYLPEKVTGLQSTGYSDGKSLTFAEGSLKLNHVYEVKDAGRVMLIYWPPLDEINSMHYKTAAAKAQVLLAHEKSRLKAAQRRGVTKYYEPTTFGGSMERKFFWSPQEYKVNQYVPAVGSGLHSGPVYAAKRPARRATAAKAAVATPAKASGIGTGLWGFYELNVHRTCYATGGKKLYMYIGDTPPSTGVRDAKGNLSSGVIELDLEAERSKQGSGKMRDGNYVVNAKGSGERKKGYLYFAVDVDPRYEAELKKFSGDDNHYSVRLWIPRWTPIFSKFFIYLQGTLLHVLYGTDVPDFGVDAKAQDVSQALSKALGENTKSQKKMGAVQHIYNNQVTSKPFWAAARALLVLYLMFSVLGYIIGVLQVTKYDLSVRVAKISLIAMLISPTSWKFFNDHWFSLFTIGIPDIISAFNGYLGGDSSFEFLDSTIGLMITSEFWLRMLSLLTAGPVGWMLLFGIVWALWALFVAMMTAIIKYLFVMVALAFLITLAPLFITFLLFQYTRGIFDGWLKMIVNFALQPIILFAALAFLNQIVITSLHAVTDFSACESCAVGFDISSKDPESPGKKDICLIPALLPIGFSNDMSVDDRIREGLAKNDTNFMGLPFSVAMVLVLILACKATGEFVQITETLAHSISGSVAGIAASAMGASQAMLGVVGLDHATQGLIKSARNMTPPNTDKIKFEGKESTQPRHDAVARSGNGVPGAAGDGDAASGGSRVRRGTRALDSLLEDRAYGGGASSERDDRYSELPRSPGGGGTNVLGRGTQAEHVYESVEDLSDTASIASGEYENIDRVGGAGADREQSVGDIASGGSSSVSRDAVGTQVTGDNFGDPAQGAGTQTPADGSEANADNRSTKADSVSGYGVDVAYADSVTSRQYDGVSGGSSDMAEGRKDASAGPSDRGDADHEGRSVDKSSSGTGGADYSEYGMERRGDSTEEERINEAPNAGDSASRGEFEDLLSGVHGIDEEGGLHNGSVVDGDKSEDIASGGDDQGEEKKEEDK